MLPTDAQERKNIPVYSGFICYFPLAMAEVAKHSRESNEQHNPGERLHWNRDKSKDERDAQARHLLDQALPCTLDEEITHARAGAWRAMANLEKLCEKRERIPDAHFDGSDKDENSVSKKIAQPNSCGEYWSGAGETVEQFRARTAGEDGARQAKKLSTRQAPRSLL